MRRSPEGAWKYLRVQILHEVGQDQRSAAFVEKLDLAEKRSAHQNSFDVVGPFGWRSVSQLTIDPDAGIEYLVSTCKAPCDERQGVRNLGLPIRQEHPMRDVRCEQVLDPAQTL